MKQKITIIQNDDGFYRVYDEDGKIIEDITSIDVNITNNYEFITVTKEVKLEKLTANANIECQFLCPNCEQVSVFNPDDLK